MVLRARLLNVSRSTTQKVLQRFGKTERNTRRPYYSGRKEKKFWTTDLLLLILIYPQYRQKFYFGTLVEQL